MAKEESTQKVVKRLRDAGFERVRTKGSHSVWKNGSVQVTVPDGHKTISAGVVRKIDEKIAEAQK
ncbi:type II toxin-antitoxin system HicA family toxin [Leifsonia sp. NPDC014704]|uniref:type II toxin-antitoxin system HicA family toxin n=1 Tax=Leifsonia sp. NPDC014704 TaxID=3364123 RepID=UPI0036F49DA5